LTTHRRRHISISGSRMRCNLKNQHRKVSIHGPYQGHTTHSKPSLKLLHPGPDCALLHSHRQSSQPVGKPRLHKITKEPPFDAFHPTQYIVCRPSLSIPTSVLPSLRLTFCQQLHSYNDRRSVRTIINLNSFVSGRSYASVHCDGAVSLMT
jgi:hypothetical protein